jgi:hypothetical protein
VVKMAILRQFKGDFVVYLSLFRYDTNITDYYSKLNTEERAG